jgi:adenylosuccinate synthase
LQEVGREWGVSTGRRRRCGWIDLVQVKYSTLVNAYTSLNLTKVRPTLPSRVCRSRRAVAGETNLRQLDILDGLKTVKLAIGYRDRDTGEELPTFPADLELLERIDVVWKEMPGWAKSTVGTTRFEDLPKEAQDYVLAIEDIVGVRVRWIGTGPAKEQMIDRGA